MRRLKHKRVKIKRGSAIARRRIPPGIRRLKHKRGKIKRGSAIARRRIPPGAEWLVDAHGCDPAALRSRETLAALFESVVGDLGLRPAGEPAWRVFPGEGGITGLLLLTESHLACHTFPERGFAAFNLYCCRPREEWPWRERLSAALGARDVKVLRLERGRP